MNWWDTHCVLPHGVLLLLTWLYQECRLEENEVGVRLLTSYAAHLWANLLISMVMLGTVATGKGKPWHYAMLLACCINGAASCRLVLAPCRRYCLQPQPRGERQGTTTSLILRFIVAACSAFTAFVWIGKWLFELMLVDWEFAILPLLLVAGIWIWLRREKVRPGAAWAKVAVVCFGFWMLYLAQAGLDGSTFPRDVSSGSVPRHIFSVVFNKEQRDAMLQTFTDCRYQRSMRSWPCAFPESAGYTHAVYTIEDGLRCVELHFPYMVHWMQPGAAFRGSQHEVTRYCLLFDKGGLYHDVDYEAVQPFFEDMAPGTAYAAESLYGDFYQNSMLASPPRHPAFASVLREASKRLGKPFFIDMWWVLQTGTGPIEAVWQRAASWGAWVRVVACATGISGACLPEGSVALFPCRVFQPPVRGVHPRCGPGLDVNGTISRAKAIHWNTFGWSGPAAAEAACSIHHPEFACEAAGMVTKTTTKI